MREDEGEGDVSLSVDYINIMTETHTEKSIRTYLRNGGPGAKVLNLLSDQRVCVFVSKCVCVLA